MPASARHQAAESSGSSQALQGSGRLPCLRRLNRSSSAAATTSPSTTSAAAGSWKTALTPSTRMDRLIPAVAAANRGSPAGTPARLPGLAGAGLLDRRHEVALAHPGPPGDVELAGDVEQVRLGGVG